MGIGSEEHHFAGSVDSSLMISCTDVGSSSVIGSTSLGMMTGAAAAAVDARILATLSTKNLAKSSALSLSVADCDGGCSRLLTVFHSAVSSVPETACARHSDCQPIAADDIDAPDDE